MTQEDYKLFTGQTVSYSKPDWERLVAVASKRLASFLCLDALPAPLPDDLAMLLANWIAAVLRWQGNADAQIESKSVRNFTIHFSSNSAANAFAQLAANYSDIIDAYSECGSSIHVENSKGYCCGRI